MKKIMDTRVKGILTALTIGTILYMLLFACILCNAQNVTKQGNTFIEQNDTTKGKPKGKVYETDYIYVDKQGHAYTIYLSSNGNAFIDKISKKSGRKYRKYLPEITKRIKENIK